MRVLCPRCELYHDVVRALDDGSDASGPGVYQIAPLPDCPQTSLSERDLLEAAARHGEEAVLPEETDE